MSKSCIQKVVVDLKKNTPEAVRYAAYSLSDRAYVGINGKGSAKAEVSFRLKKEQGTVKNIIPLFKEALAEEKLREKIFFANSGLREYLIKRALSETPKAEEKSEGLSPEQEKELQDLISQVESEIKKEMKKDSASDPLDIKRTWEEKYGDRKNRK